MKTNKYHQKGEMLFTAISAILLAVGLIVIPVATIDDLSDQPEKRNGIAIQTASKEMAKDER